MKQKIIAILLMLLPCVISAQYYGQHDVNTCSGKVACGACFGSGYCDGYQCMACGGTGVIQCPMCVAYKMGQRAAEQQKNARWNNAFDCLQDGINYFMQESYGKALRYFKRSAELGNPQANMYIGEMYEFGFGVEGSKTTAKRWYDKGASQGDIGCQNRLQRIRQYGYFEANAQNRRAYLQNMREISNWASVSAKQMTDQIWGNSSSSGSNSSRSSSSSRKQSCSSCGGTGVDPTPNSGGALHNWVAHYNSSGTKCRYCGRYTGHYHDKCSSCNVPRY